jgi:hypothetical protein
VWIVSIVNFEKQLRLPSSRLLMVGRSRNHNRTGELGKNTENRKQNSEFEEPEFGTCTIQADNGGFRNQSGSSWKVGSRHFQNSESCFLNSEFFFLKCCPEHCGLAIPRFDRSLMGTRGDQKQVSTTEQLSSERDGPGDNLKNRELGLDVGLAPLFQ